MNVTKITKPLLAFAVVSFLLPNAPATAAESSDKATVGISTVYEGKKGKTVTLDVYISGEEIAGGSLELDYDETALSVSKAEAGSGLQEYLSSVNKSEAGTVALTWAKAEGQSQSGTLLTITAKRASEGEAIDLDLTNVRLYKQDGSAVEADVFDGMVKAFDGKQQTHKEKVKGSRSWTIKLNKAVNPATVNTKTVKILNSRGMEMDIAVNVKGKQSFTVQPKAALGRGTYKLLITEQVHSANGSPLKEPIQFEYTVE